MTPEATFDHGGGMGARMRHFPWHTTSLQSPEHWPAALHSTLNVVLLSQQPMLLLWGAEHLCFFNDAYAESIPGRLSDELLGSCAKAMDSDTWKVMAPAVRGIMTGDRAPTTLAQSLVLTHNGDRDEVRWAYSFSPIEFNSARFGVGGVLVACTETARHGNVAHRNQFLVALADATLDCRTPNAVMAVVTKHLGEHLDACRCDFGYLDTSAQVIQLVEEWTDGSVPRTLGEHSLHHYKNGFRECLLAGTPFIIENSPYRTETEHGEHANVDCATDLGNSVVTLIGNTGHSPAMLLVQATPARVWTRDDMMLIGDTASRAWNWIERLQAEHRLRESERGLRAMYDGSDTLFLLAEPNGTVVDCNRATREFVTAPHDTLVGQSSWDGPLGKDSTEETRCRLRSATAQAATGGIVRVQIALGRNARDSRIIDLCIYPIRDARNEVVLIVYEGRDVTEPVLTAQASADADRRKDEFMAILSHELRSPLAALRSAAYLLDSPDALPQVKRLAPQMIQRQVSRMTRLVDDLLDVTRIAQGKLQLNLETVTVSSLIEAAVECARPLITDKKQNLTVHLAMPHNHVTVDALRISQVICNLLTNAAKYTDPQGRIDLGVRMDDEALIISIADSGIGLDSYAIKNIFSMFSQVETGSVRSAGGLGIGLALVKGLAALHGGTIEAFSAGLGQGSTFVLRLPACLVARPSCADLPREDDEYFVSRRILLVDDNEASTNMLAELLRIDGHEVVAAFTGHAAMALAASFNPEFALLDISLPDMSGYELARALKAGQGAHRLTLVAITGWGNADDRQRAFEAGFQAHLIKPIDDQKLRAILSQTDVERSVTDCC